MIPSSLIPLEKIPLTRSGKTDLKSLPKPEETNFQANYTAPCTDVEARLADIWSDILGIERVGIHDNFFELGGDSILSIQVIARARQAGMQLTPKQLFQHQSIAELASVATLTPTTLSEQGAVTGTLPPTPIQSWFIEQALPSPHHYNQAVLLDVPPDLNPRWAEQATQHLIAHHDILRLRCLPDAKSEGALQLTNITSQDIFSAFDLSAQTQERQQAELESIAERIQGSLDLAQGPIMRVALFTLGDKQPSRLLFVIHHLAVDGVSWRILLEDWQNIYERLSQNEAPRLPPKTSSFKTWAERLQNYAQSEKLTRESDHWLSVASFAPPPLPRDYPGPHTPNTVESAERVSVTLSTDQTRALLEEVPHIYHTQINDVLLTALTRCLLQWTGETKALIDLEGHGREDLFDDIDLSRTVGWFTTVYPVCLELSSEICDPGADLKSIKEQLRGVPGNGIGYGLLRHLRLNETIQKRLRELPQAELSFNYLGQFDQLFAPTLWLGQSRESTGASYSPLGKRSHLMEVEGRVMKGRLQIDWIYSEHYHCRTTVEQLAQGFKQNLIELILHCQSPQAGGYTPSDFPLAGLDDKKLEKLTSLLRKGGAS